MSEMTKCHDKKIELEKEIENLDLYVEANICSRCYKLSLGNAIWCHDTILHAFEMTGKRFQILKLQIFVEILNFTLWAQKLGRKK